MLLSETPASQHAASYIPATTSDRHFASGMNASHQDNSSHSSTSSPRSQEASIVSTTSRNTQHSLRGIRRHGSTSPSSVASSQRRGISEGSENEATGLGKKRSLDGQIKDHVKEEYVLEPGNVRKTNTVPEVGGSNMTELSQSLKTRLSYAMVKVQNGWQNNTLDEVESLASQSPRSTMSAFNRADQSSLISPRIALASKMHERSNFGYVPSSRSSHDAEQPAEKSQSRTEPYLTRKSLGPAATILSGARRRPSPNSPLQVNTMRPPQTSRPKAQERTPSQNAAMEADAVETLLFMSSSPKTSGTFPPLFSPISQVFSSQTSPVRTHFSPAASRQRYVHEDRSTFIDRLLNHLDDDINEDLDEACRILEQHRASKIAS